MSPTDESPRTRRAGKIVGVVLLGLVALVVIIGFFVIPSGEEEEGIDMREDVDAVVDDVEAR